MKLRLMATLIGFAVVGGLAAGVVTALWSGTQTTSGSVNATSSSVDLYICEPNADRANTGCGPDDSGANETIFEGTEDLLPGESAWAAVRLRNVGSTDVDILRAQVSLTEVSDPGGDCGVIPLEDNVTLWPLGKFYWYDPMSVYLYGGDVEHGNDNHQVVWGWLPLERQAFSSYAPGMPYPISGGAGGVMHIASGDYEDMAVKVRMPFDAQSGCEDGVWSVSVEWEVVYTTE